MNETETLRGLILMAKRTRDKSLRQLAFDAQAAGHKIVGTTLSGIEKGTYKSVPSVDTIKAIGWLAGVSDDVSFAAAGRPRPGPPFAEELPPGVDDLSSKERRAAIDMLRALVAQRQEIIRYESDPSVSSPPQSRTPSEANEGQEGVDAAAALGLDDESFRDAYNLAKSGDVPFRALWNAGYRIEHRELLRSAFAAASAKTAARSGLRGGVKFWKAVAAELGGDYTNRGLMVPPPAETVTLGTIGDVPSSGEQQSRASVSTGDSPGPGLDNGPADAEPESIAQDAQDPHRQSDYELVRGRKRDPRVKPEIPDGDDFTPDPEGPEGGA